MSDWSHPTADHKPLFSAEPGSLFSEGETGSSEKGHVIPSYLCTITLLLYFPKGSLLIRVSD